MGKQSRQKQERRESGDTEEKTSQSGLEKACLFIIQWGTYLVLFVPLYVNTDFFFPFVSPKSTLFRIVIEIILVAYIFLVMINKRWRPRINVLTVALFLFLAVLVLTSFTGINFSRSFWSTYERMTGLFTMLHLFAFFIILTSVFKKREDWQRFLGASVLVGVILSCYVLLSDELSSRGGGTIGNTSFLASYLLFNVFFAMILFLSNFLKRAGWPLFWQIFGGISLAIMLPALLMSTARGAIAAFFVGLFLLFLGYLFFSRLKILRRAALALVLVLVLLAGTLALVQPAPVKNEIQSTLQGMNSRFVVWEKGWKGFLERPILGWGPENFNVVFLRYFNPCMSLSKCGNEVWFDRVHNIVLDTLVTTGIVGFVSYIFIFIIAIYGLLKTIPKMLGKKKMFLPLGLIALFIAYFFQNLLVFDMINSYLVFFLSLGFAAFLIHPVKPSQAGIPPKAESFNRVNPILVSVIVIATISMIWLGNIKPLLANNYIIKIAGSETVGESTIFFQKSLDSWMDKYEVRENFAQKLIRSSHGLTNLSPEEKKPFFKAYQLTEAEMKKSIRENSLDFRHHLFLGELYLASWRVSGNQEKIKEARETLIKAIELSPTNQQAYWQLAETWVADGKVKEAIPPVKKAVELEPSIGLSHWYLSLVYLFSGQHRLALEEAGLAKENNYNWMERPEDVQKVIDNLEFLGEDPAEYLFKSDLEIVEWGQELVKKDPNILDAWYYMAMAYANLKQYDLAREAAQRVIEIKPSLTRDMELFLESLPR